MKNILITGGRAPVSLHLIHLCKKAGYDVYVADSIPYYTSKSSDLVKKSFVVTKPNQDHEKFIENILEIVKKYKIDLIIPTCEEVFHLSKSKEVLEEYVKLFTMDISTLHTLHNKWTFINMIKGSNHIKVPTTYYVTNQKQIKIYLSGYSSKEEFVLKPVYSRFSSNIYFINKDKIPTVDCSRENPYVLQQRIRGEQICSYSVIQSGNIVAHSSYQTVYTLGQGAGIYFKPYQVQKVFNFIKEFSLENRINGQISFDFIMDNKGDIYPIECNPRSTSGLHLFEGNTELIDSMVKEKQECIVAYPSESICVMPILVISKIFKNGLKKTIRDIRNCKSIFKHEKDRKTLFSQNLMLSYFAINSIIKRKKMVSISTEDIEWGGK